MSIKDFEPHELTPELLDELSKESFKKGMKELSLEILYLEKMRKKIENLRVQRFAGMITLTKEKDLLDCAYVRRCLIELLMNEEDYIELKENMKRFLER